LLSLARGASGPVIAYWILQEQWGVAAVATLMSGATDWLDGYLARRMRLTSVLGSYLDPLGDKLLVCCVAVALAAKGLLPTWLATAVVARDAGLVGGLLLHRAAALGWRRVSAAEFFNTAPPLCANAAGVAQPGMATLGVPLMRPLYISKVNTVLQLALVSGCLADAWVGLPGADALRVLELATAVTTAASCAAYARKYAEGKLL